MLNQSAFAQDLVDVYRKKKLIHPHSGLAIPGEICRINCLFALLPHLTPPFWILASRPQKMVILRHSLPACRIKSYSLPQHLVSYLLTCHAASRASSDSVTSSGMYLYHTLLLFVYVSVLEIQFGLNSVWLKLTVLK